MKARGAQARIRLQRLAKKSQIRIEVRCAQTRGALKSFHLDGPPHRVGMHLELFGDGADLPMFRKKVATYLNS